MRIGVNILNFGPGADAAHLLRWAQVSEALGYHAVLISDHVAITPSVGQRYPEPYFDAFTTLAWLAGQTKRVQLGTTVIVLPYRHPILTARMVANIDKFSDGRFIFGVGVGNAEDEFKALGQTHSRRGSLANEYLRVMLALWQGQGPVSYHGRLLDMEEVSAIETVHRPHPPVWVGGNSAAALQRAARFGDGWHPILRSLAGIEDASLPQLEAAAVAAGRPVPQFCPRIRLDLREASVDGERLPGVGSLAQVASDLGELQRLGAQYVTLDWYTGDIEATRHHEHGWQMLAELAGHVLDLEHETLR